MYQFSIITPTFNRAKYLPRIYECLSQQSDLEFEWIIVDDGSSDNTREAVGAFKKQFEIKYIYQENAGKPSAMNVGIQMANSHITLATLNSDDYLYDNALKTAWDYFNIKTGRFEKDCCCLSGLCQNENGAIIGQKFPHDYFVSDYIRYFRNNGIKGDKCQFFVTKIIKQYPFPLFKGEKFIKESTVYSRIALTHKTLHLNQVFQIKQYLPGGLSSNFKKLLLVNPLGAELSYNECSAPPYNLKLQIINSGKYISFAKKNHKKNIFGKASNKLIYPLGMLYYAYQKIRKK